MKLQLLKTLCLTFAFYATVRAQDLGSVSTVASADLKKSLADLATARQNVQTERLPLAQRLAELEQKLIERRAEFAKAQRFQENQLVELNALKTEARLRSDEVKYIESLLTEYTKGFRSRLHFAEESNYKSVLNSVDKATAAADLTAGQKFEQLAPLLTASLKHAEQALGGEIFDGSALDSKGRLQSGKVAMVGPVAMFAGGDTAGVMQQELNKADPSVVRLKEHVKEASTLALTGSGFLFLDPTLGNAFKLAALDDSFFDQLRKGGLIMIPLVGMALLVLIVALFKWISLSSIRLVTETDLQKVLNHLESSEQTHALAHARSIPGLVGGLLVIAVEHVDEKKEHIEEILYEKILGARGKLDRGLAFLALSATTGPLMGLLGTVMGMIATFEAISGAGSGDPKQLAAGISEALICTAAGMSVAIPSLLLHAFLTRKSKAVLASMEHTAVGFVNGITTDGKESFTNA